MEPKPPENRDGGGGTASVAVRGELSEVLFSVSYVANRTVFRCLFTCLSRTTLAAVLEEKWESFVT